MVIPEKVINFIGSNEFYKMIEEIGKNFFSIDWQDQKMPFLIAFIVEVFKKNKKGDALKDLAKEFLNFLNEEELNKFLNYFEENYRNTIEELWQEGVKEEKQIEEAEESYEEKEKRYLELMKGLLKEAPQEEPPSFFFEEDYHKKEKTDSETPEKVTISFAPEETIKIPTELEKQEPELPEGTIIIRKEKKEKKESEDLLDLSHL